MEIIVKKEVIIGEVTKKENQKIQVAVIESNIGEFVAVTDMYMKDDVWKKGKGKWIPAEIADEIGELIIKAHEEWVK